MSLNDCCVDWELIGDLALEVKAAMPCYKLAGRDPCGYCDPCAARLSVKQVLLG